MTEPRGDSGRGEGRTAPWVAPEHRTGDVRCSLCGAVNSASAAFCRWCGTPLGRPTDPVLGTTTHRALEARHGNPLGSILGALLAVALVGVATWAFLGGGLTGGTEDARPSPSRAAVASLSPSPAPSAALSNVPSEMPPPPQTPSPAPPSAASMSPSATPTSPPAATGFTCDPASIRDSTSASWRLIRVRWGPRGPFDQLALVLEQRRSTSDRATVVSVESVPSADVTERFGLPPPSAGDRAIVVTFDGPVGLPSPIESEPALGIIKDLLVHEGTDGLVRAVVGVTGDGCHRLSAPAWSFGAAPQEVEVILDVREP